MADFRTANEKINCSIMLCHHFAILFSDISRNCIKGLLFFFLLSLFSSVVSATDFSYSPVVESSKDFTSFLFYKSGFNYISEFSVTYPAGSVTFVNPSNSTSFSIVSGGTGSGTVSYSDVTRKVTWVFTLGNITSNSFVVSYSSNIFNDISLVGGGFDFSVDYDCQAPWSYAYTYRWAQSGPSPVAPVSVSGGGIKYNFPGGNSCGSGYWQGYGSSYIGAINASVSVTAPPIDNANLIVASESPDYNFSISSTDNSNIYLTTWVNNSNWAFWSPLYTYIWVTNPRGDTKKWAVVWGQNAYQSEFLFDYFYGYKNVIYGTYSFSLKCDLCSNSVLSTATVTYVNPADAPDTIDMSVSGNNVSVSYFVNPLTYSNNLGSITMDVTYIRQDSLNPASGILCSSDCKVPMTWNGTFSLDSFIASARRYAGGVYYSDPYFSGYLTEITANVYASGTKILTISKLYQYHATSIPTPTVVPTSIPTPNMTFGPIPTIAPIPNGTNISTNSPSDFDNYTQSQSDALNGSVSGIGGFVAGTINGMRGGIQSINSSLSSFSYEVDMPILVILVGSFMAALPAKLKTVYGLFFIFAIILIVLGRDKK